MIQRFLITTLVLLALLSGCSTSNEEKPEPPITTTDSTYVVLLHTNDVHGRIQGFPRLKFIVDSLSEVHDNVYLLSAGDMFSGNPYVDQYDPKGYPMIDLMNMCEYDVATLGNHEFDYGQAVLKDRIEQAKFPFLCANIIDPEFNIGTTSPGIILKTKNNKSVSIGGLLQVGSNGYPASHPDKMKGLVFENPLANYAKYKALIPDGDIRIMLTHLGHNADKTLANKDQSLHLIIGGHSHTKLKQPIKQGNVYVAQAASNLNYVGYEEVLLKEGVFSLKKAGLYSLSDELSYNQEVKKKVEQYENNSYFTDPIGTMAAEIYSSEYVGYVMTDSWRSELNADMAFQNSGGIRYGKIPAGDITRAQIFTIDPFSNQAVTFKLSYSELYQFLRDNTDLVPSGVHIDRRNGGLKLMDTKGNPLDENKSYTIATSSYVTARRQQSFSFKTHDVTTAELTIQYIQKKKTLDYRGIPKRLYR
ncbi:bifunctional metallophosphatase/5'-nucleotidase [Prolixibacteraceae bacterium JC049]|nr:bifunctional metallophosphatase/5'-nucleotidase [Prolixibacteraceae bacterium JC049]